MKYYKHWIAEEGGFYNYFKTDGEMWWCLYLRGFGPWQGVAPPENELVEMTPTEMAMYLWSRR